MKSVDWTPIRRGNIYCSPACGGSCSFAGYEKACAEASETARRLGTGWTPVIYENLGWWWRVEYEVDLLDGITDGPIKVSVRKISEKHWWATIDGHFRNSSGSSPERALAGLSLQVDEIYRTAQIYSVAVNTALSSIYSQGEVSKDDKDNDK